MSRWLGLSEYDPEVHTENVGLVLLQKCINDSKKTWPHAKICFILSLMSTTAYYGPGHNPITLYLSLSDAHKLVVMYL